MIGLPGRRGTGLTETIGTGGTGTGWIGVRWAGTGKGTVSPDMAGVKPEERTEGPATGIRDPIDAIKRNKDYNSNPKNNLASLLI